MKAPILLYTQAVVSMALIVSKLKILVTATNVFYLCA
jgi:hypothetical protein